MKPVRITDKEIIKQESSEDTELSEVEVDQVSFQADESGVELKPSRWFTILLLIVSLLALLQIVDATISAFETHLYLGIALSVVILLVISAAARQIFRFLKNKKELLLHEKWRKEVGKINHIKSHGKAMPILKKIHSSRFSKNGAEFDKLCQRTELCQDDTEVIHLYSKDILSHLDEHSKQLIIRHATDSSIMIALSPFAAIDMLLVLWRNLKMVNDIAEIYGLNHSPWSKFKIMKSIFKNMMLMGAQELAMDVTFDSVGVSLGTKLSTRAAQGIGAGLMTLRIGIKTIEYCRPVELLEDEKFKVSSLRGRIITQVKDRLLSAVKESE